MADNNWSRWYREGTVNLTQGSKIVTGSNTYWLSAGLHAGDIFSLDGVSDYEIDSVTSDTQLTLRTVYTGSSVSGETYSIVRNFTSTMPAEIAAKTAGLVGDFIRYIDTDMQSIHGKSAYELAKANGYVGTEAQWLESITAYGLAKIGGYSGTQSEWLASLKGDSAYQVAVKNGYTGTESEWLESLIGAGQWTTLDSRTKILAPLYVGTRRKIHRFKNLGTTFTEAQYNAIKSGTFDDLYIGDYWTDAEGNRWRIADMQYFKRSPVYWSMRDIETGEKRFPNYPSRWYGGTKPATPDSIYVNVPYHIVVLCDMIQYKQYSNEPYYTSEQVQNGDMQYEASNYYQVVRPRILEAASNLFGSEHILDYPATFINAWGTDGKPTGWKSAWGKCELVTYEQVTGEYYPDPYGRGSWDYRYYRDSWDKGRFELFTDPTTGLYESHYMREVIGNGSGSWGSPNITYGRWTSGTDVTAHYAHYGPLAYICIGESEDA